MIHLVLREWISSRPQCEHIAAGIIHMLKCDDRVSCGSCHLMRAPDGIR